MPDQTLEEVRMLLGSNRFLMVDESYQLLYSLLRNWDWLNSKQREQLRPWLVQSFDSFKSYMGAFVAAEIFGELYCDEKALLALVDLGTRSRMPARSLVPHGLEYLSVSTTDERLKTMSIDALQKLANDKIGEVRDEARTSLRRLGLGIRES